MSTHIHDHLQYQNNRGALLVLVLVFGAVFFLIVVSFMGFVVTQSQVQTATVERERALSIAEAGLNYYKWYLAHNPNDTTHGTGQPGPYEIPFTDPELGVIGTSSLVIASTTYCGVVSSIEITSTGYTAEAPDTTRTVFARYARPTVAEYSYIINSNVWAGSDRTITGPYHSNGAIRMDGTNNSTVSSNLETWECDGTINCDEGGVSVGDDVSGVFGDGPNSALWNVGVPPIGFAGLTVDLSAIETAACTPGSTGICIPSSGNWGYRVDFQSDNTVDVYTVTDVFSYDGYNSADGWTTERNVIDNDSFFATYTIDETCPLIFVEDKVWLEGEVPTLVSLAAADNDLGDPDHSIILNDNITYATTSAGLLAVAEEDVLIGLDVPEVMEVNGIFIAQNGRFGRNNYDVSGLPTECLWWTQYWIYGWICTGGWVTMFADKVQLNELTVNGTIVSNGRVGTKWSAGEFWLSGFNTRFNSYDRFLVDNPPPLAPNTSEDYKFVEWREQD
jgi:hypothetical protein